MLNGPNSVIVSTTKEEAAYMCMVGHCCCSQRWGGSVEVPGGGWPVPGRAGVRAFSAPSPVLSHPPLTFRAPAPHLPGEGAELSRLEVSIS